MFSLDSAESDVNSALQWVFSTAWLVNAIDTGLQSSFPIDHQGGAEMRADIRPPLLNHGLKSSTQLAQGNVPMTGPLLPLFHRVSLKELAVIRWEKGALTLQGFCGHVQFQDSCTCGAGIAMDRSLTVKRPITSFQSGAHVAKRSRFLDSKGDNVKVMAEAPNLDSREAESMKAGVVAHTRKSNDSPAVVPIKKRRIQILETTRSPSPPPTSPPQEVTPPQSISPELSAPLGEMLTPVSSSSSLLGFSSASSPRSSVPFPVPSSMSQPHLPPVSQGQPTNSIVKAEIPVVCKLDPKDELFANFEKCRDDEDNIAAPLGSINNMNGQILQDTVLDQFCSQAKPGGRLIRSESDSFSKDDRLHWDLNTDMAAWDASTEQGTIMITEGKHAAVSPPRSPSVDSARTIQKERNVSYNEDARQQLEEDLDYGEVEAGGQTCVSEEFTEDREGILEGEADPGEEVLEELDAGKHAVSDPEIGEHCEEDQERGEQKVEEPALIEEDIYKNSEFRDVEKGHATSQSGHVEGAWNVPNVKDFPDLGKRGSWDSDLSLEGRDVRELSETQCHQDDMAERQKPGKHGKASSDDVEGWNYEPELEEHVDYGDSDCRDADDSGLDIDDRTSMMQAESHWNEEGGIRSQKDTCEGEASIAGEMLKSSISDVGQTTSEPSPGRYPSSGRSRPTGWDQLPEGFNSAEEALKAAKEGSVRRGGRGGLWSSPSGRGSLHSASRFGPSLVRSNTRDGFSSSRGDSYYGERHPDEAVYDRDGFRHGRRVDDNFNVRGRDPSRRPGIFGRGRAGGWMDSQLSHINQWGPARHRPGSGFSGPLNENSGFAVAPDGTGTKHGMGPGRGGIRFTVIGGRVGRGGHARGPPVEMDGGVHYPLRAGGVDRVAGLGAGAGPGYSGSMHDRSGRVMMDRYRGGGMESRRSLSPRRQHPSDYSNIMGRMLGMRPDSRVVRSRTPPPIHRSMGSSEFNTVRNQRSPPPSSRWSVDKREADSYQDRDFKRPLSRTRVPPQRTSPHVIHGSSLTDERDRQVLAGSRHSPPLKSSVAPTHLRKSKDDSLDLRPSKRFEEDDARYAGPFGKDGDYRNSSPLRENDREREKGNLYRRDRDRDEERRRDFRRSSSRDGRFPVGSKHSSIREADDDIAPRRRRPS
ncbi:hypothetical protein L7F22_063930 [Adiantum nelumboides]|nr:hypothetical protein [Adiantum nelumboides]